MSANLFSDTEVLNNEYDDYDVQTVLVKVETRGDLGGSSIFVENFHNEEVAGGLSRDEVAELVGYHEFLSFEPQEDTELLDISQGFELSADSTSKLLEDGSEVTENEDVDGNTGLDQTVGGSTDPSILRLIGAGGVSGVEDDTNGPGAGGPGTMVTTTIPYRMWYGRGPTFDRHNELFWHYYTEQQAGVLTKTRLTCQFIWDVADRSQF